jgi:PLAT/LH2 domain
MRRRITASLLGAAVLVATFAVGQQAAVAEPSKADEVRKADKLRKAEQHIQWSVKVRTGSYQFAGTDANVYLRIFGSNVSNWHPRKWGFFDAHIVGRRHHLGDWLEQGSVDTIGFTYNDPGHVSDIWVWRDNAGWSPSWYLGSITFQHPVHGDRIFSYNTWIPSGQWTRPR